MNLTQPQPEPTPSTDQPTTPVAASESNGVPAPPQLSATRDRDRDREPPLAFRPPPYLADHIRERIATSAATTRTEVLLELLAAGAAVRGVTPPPPKTDTLKTAFAALSEAIQAVARLRDTAAKKRPQSQLHRAALVSIEKQATQALDQISEKALEVSSAIKATPALQLIADHSAAVQKQSLSNPAQKLAQHRQKLTQLTLQKLGIIANPHYEYPATESAQAAQMQLIEELINQL